MVVCRKKGEGRRQKGEGRREKVEGRRVDGEGGSIGDGEAAAVEGQL